MSNKNKIFLHSGAQQKQTTHVNACFIISSISNQTRLLTNVHLRQMTNFKNLETIQSFRLFRGLFFFSCLLMNFCDENKGISESSYLSISYF